MDPRLPSEDVISASGWLAWSWICSIKAYPERFANWHGLVPPTGVLLRTPYAYMYEPVIMCVLADGPPWQEDARSAIGGWATVGGLPGRAQVSEPT